jgi:porphobilinogen synthase
MAFPQTRMRRLRASAGLRGLVRETDVHAGQFVLPLFVTEAEPSGGGDGSSPADQAGARAGRQPIATMPGVDRLSLSALVAEAQEAAALGIAAVMLFGVPAEKDDHGSGAWDHEGIVQLATRAIKQAVPELLVITDVCLCEYTSHGHCGVLMTDGDTTSVDNDATLELLARTAVSHARAGADIVAPSDMMDGRVGAIREELDGEGLSETPILAYSAKFASAFYGPFREAADSAPAFGDRRGYQMDPANGREAVREALLDVHEGADMVMVKPALAYGDLIRAVKRATRLPVAAYNVSGEYAMVKAAAAAGYLDERATVLEILTSLRRAGADTIITYHAKDAATWLAEQS